MIPVSIKKLDTNPKIKTVGRIVGAVASIGAGLVVSAALMPIAKLTNSKIAKYVGMLGVAAISYGVSTFAQKNAEAMVNDYATLISEVGRTIDNEPFDNSQTR